MPIVRRTLADIDRAKLLADLAAFPQPSEEEIERQAIEDGNAWTDEDFANAVITYPPPTPDEIRALRANLALSQVDFAHRFGIPADTLQQYEQGRRVPSRPVCTLFRVIEANPHAVTSALRTPRPNNRPRRAAAE